MNHKCFCLNLCLKDIDRMREGCKRYVITCTYETQQLNKPREYWVQVETAMELINFFKTYLSYGFEDISLLSRGSSYISWEVTIFVKDDINNIIQKTEEAFKDKWTFGYDCYED